MGIVSDPSPEGLRPNRPPAYFWAVGLLSLLWNVWGAYIALSAQSGSLPALRAEDQAYFDSQPLWFVIFADLGPFAGLAGAVALLLHSRTAMWFFVAQICITGLANGYEVLLGRSLLLTNPDTRTASLVLAVCIAAEIAYAWFLTRRRVLY